LKGVLILILVLSLLGAEVTAGSEVPLKQAPSSEAGDEDLYPVLKLNSLIERANKENHEIVMAKARIESSRYRIPQEGALPDPMVMIGYENEGWNRYTYGEMPGSRWMVSASQTFPWPGKLSLQKKASTKESEAVYELYEKTRLSVIEELKIRYYELYYAWKGLDIIEEKLKLFELIEEIASKRYSSGMASLGDLTMAQTERYMALQERIMLRQKIESLQAMINSLISRDPALPLGRPEELIPERIEINQESLKNSIEDLPDIKEKKRLLEAKDLKYQKARLEYYPDITLTCTISLKPDPYEDMWGLTVTLNIPLFYRSKQRMAILERSSERDEAYHELEGTRQMVASRILDLLSMIKASEELMELYKKTFIPKAEQSLEANISSYRAGRIELVQVIKALNSLLDYKLMYWFQVAERQKALASLERLIGRPLSSLKEGNR
jgi:cobalt-zinc-cadmium efflux system outer membrane protein